MGVLLAEPQRWHDVQQFYSPADFTSETLRELAEQYWRRQQDEGEPVFNQFLGELKKDELVELAVTLIEEIETLPEINVALEEAGAFLKEVRQRREEQKLTAQLHRTNGQLGEQVEVDLLKSLQEKRRQPDLRRVVIDPGSET
jgi:hypothetical protein